MADSIEVTLTLGYDSLRPNDALDAYLTGPLGAPAWDGTESGQHLDLICGRETHPLDLPGSGQAGVVRVYAGVIRRGNPNAVIAYLRAAPWGSVEAVAVVHHDFGGPAYVERLGYEPGPAGWGS